MTDREKSSRAPDVDSLDTLKRAAKVLGSPSLRDEMDRIGRLSDEEAEDEIREELTRQGIDPPVLTSGSDSERARLLYSLCVGCGTLIPPGRVCDRCGEPQDLSEDEEIQLRINLTVQTCDECRSIVAWEDEACPSCGAPLEPSDPRTASLNQAKLNAYHSLLDQFENLTAVNESYDRPLPVTDDQLLSFIQRNEVLDRLRMDEFKAVASNIDLSSEESIRSRQTRESFDALLNQTRKIREIYDDLTIARPAGQLEGFHTSLLQVSKSRLEAYAWAARALLGVTIDDIESSQRALQASLDVANEAAEAMSRDFSSFNVSEEGVIDRRLGEFTGIPGSYEHEGQPDFAAVLTDGLQHHTLKELAERGASYFGSSVSSDPQRWEPERALPLYLTAAATAASDDPLTIRRRTNELFDLLDEAFGRDSAEFSTALAAAEPDIEDALVALLGKSDQLRLVQLDLLSREAARLTLSETYNLLVEWVYRRLVNLPLAAKFILAGKPEDYVEIRARGFGDKYHILAQERDPRFGAALSGVAKVIRNAGAHGEVDLSGQLIHFRSEDRKGRVDEEDMTDEEFAARLADLLITCLALRLSADLVRLERWHELSEATFPTARRTAVEVARTVPGYWGLSNLEIRAEDGAKKVEVQAFQRATQGRSQPFDFLAGAATLAVLFPDWPELCLRVVREGGEQFEITVPTGEAVAYLSLPEEAKLLGALKLWYLSRLEPSSGTQLERYRGEWILGSARFLAKEIAKLQALRVRLPKTARRYASGVERVIRIGKVLDEYLRTLEPPAEGVPDRDRFRVALRSLESGLTAHLSDLRSGRWASVGRQPDPIGSAVETIVDLLT